MDHALLQDFITEAGEHLEELESGLLQLESDPENVEILNDIFRSVHSIKGAAQFVGIENISSLTHRLETLLDLARNKQVSLHQNVVDTLMASKDRLAKLTEDLAEGRSEQASVEDLIAAINLLIESPETSEDMTTTPSSAVTPLPAPEEDAGKERYGFLGRRFLRRRAGSGTIHHIHRSVERKNIGHPRTVRRRWIAGEKSRGPVRNTGSSPDPSVGGQLYGL